VGRIRPLHELRKEVLQCLTLIWQYIGVTTSETEREYALRLP